ncbi:hypothetical protein IPM62_01580 [Candidatus Woesebacteria bacterium]|nr:MAG: hypothetical protein IPM62_01580 [Candidatus Woesebacteria bacterium]
MINNPVFTPELASMNGTDYFSSIFKSFVGLVILAGVIILVFMIITGAISWISSGGNVNQIEQAKKKIAQGIAGMTVILSIFFIVNLVGCILGIGFTSFEISEFNIQFSGSSLCKDWGGSPGNPGGPRPTVPPGPEPTDPVWPSGIPTSPPGEPTPTLTPEAPLIAGTVRYFLSQDYIPRSNAHVTLLNSSNNIISTTISDGVGYYSFIDNIEIGQSYWVYSCYTDTAGVIYSGQRSSFTAPYLYARINMNEGSCQYPPPNNP